MATEIITANMKIPYGLISRALGNNKAGNFNRELTDIMKYYEVYKKGMEVVAEGTQGDYTPSTLRVRRTAQLINKEARFLYGKRPEFNITHRGNVEVLDKSDKKEVENISQYIGDVLDANQIEDKLVKAAKDCFIGKRVAYLVNFNESMGVSITWLNSSQFYYELFPENDSMIKRFVAWINVEESTAVKDKRIWQKEYNVNMEDGKIYMTEGLYDGTGSLIGEETENQAVELSMIPAGIILNDGLISDREGQSDVEEVMDGEGYYSNLMNADMDAGRKGMNPIKYFVDMNPVTTKKNKLSVSPGSVWDLASDTTIRDNVTGQVGTLESQFSYSKALNDTLKRIKSIGYEQLDIPDINLEQMSGLMLSGKGLKAIYWGMIIRCNEKFKAWEPSLRKLVDILIEGAIKFPKTVEKYTNEVVKPVRYRVDIVNQFPLPEDEEEEKKLDQSDVDTQTMSKRTYMKKWRGLTDAEVQDELEQMALEREILEDSFGLHGTEAEDGDDEFKEGE